MELICSKTNTHVGYNELNGIKAIWFKSRTCNARDIRVILDLDLRHACISPRSTPILRYPSLPLRRLHAAVAVAICLPRLAVSRPGCSIDGRTPAPTFTSLCTTKPSEDRSWLLGAAADSGVSLIVFFLRGIVNFSSLFATLGWWRTLLICPCLDWWMICSYSDGIIVLFVAELLVRIVTLVSWSRKGSGLKEENHGRLGFVVTYRRKINELVHINW